MLSVAEAEARMNGRTRKYKKILETIKNSTSVDVNCSSREIDKKTKRCHGWTPLTRACSENKYFNVRLLLDLNADVNESNRVGETPLYWAIYNENVDIVKLLLQYNVDVNKKMNNFEGRTPLHYIAWDIDSKFFCTGIKSDEVAINDIAILLLQHNANINATDNSGNTPLNIFSDGGNFNLAKIFLEHGADINIANNIGNTPLHSSYVPNDDFKIFKLLLEYNPDVNIANKRGETPLHLAFSHRNFEIFKLLIDRNADVNLADNDGQTPLHLASQYKYGNTETVIEILIKNNADVNKTNKKGETPLYLATYKGHSDIINLLLNHNADVNISDNNGNTPLHIVANDYNYETRCHIEIAKKLIKHKADINKTNKRGETALNLASHYFLNSDMVNLLLQQNADVNIEDKINGRTPLHKASFLGRKEIVKMILEKKHNADINKTDNNEATALLLASIYAHSDIVNLLLQHNADANIADLFGRTPLHYTSLLISNYDIEIAEMLIQHNADINKTDKKGATALHFASDIGNSKIVNLLLQHNADVNITDVNGKTPLQLALLKEHTVIIDLFKQYNSCEKRKLILESKSSVQPQNKKICK